MQRGSFQKGKVEIWKRTARDVCTSRGCLHMLYHPGAVFVKGAWLSWSCCWHRNWTKLYAFAKARKKERIHDEAGSRKSGIECNELVENHHHHHHQCISCVGEAGAAHFNTLHHRFQHGGLSSSFQRMSTFCIMTRATMDSQFSFTKDMMQKIISFHMNWICMDFDKVSCLGNTCKTKVHYQCTNLWARCFQVHLIFWKNM